MRVRHSLCTSIAVPPAPPEDPAGRDRHETACKQDTVIDEPIYLSIRTAENKAVAACRSPSFL